MNSRFFRILFYAIELSAVSLHYFLLYSFLEFSRWNSARDSANFRSRVFWAAFLLWLAILWFKEGYRHTRIQTYRTAFKRTLVQGLVFLISFASASYLLNFDFLNQIFLLSYAAASTVVLLAIRFVILFFARRARRKGYNLRNILLAGTGRRAQRFMSLVAKHPEWGYRIVGLLDRDPVLKGENIADYKVLGTLEELPQILEKRPIDEVFFVIPRKWLDAADQSIRYCEAVGIPATLSTDLFDLEIAKGTPRNLDGTSYVTFETRLLKGGELLLKRFLDIFSAAAFLILSSPVLAGAALAVKWSSPGPVFFKQIRCGLNGRKFSVYKFRSMITGAEARLKELKSKNEMTGPVFKMTHDPRITAVGKILRKYSLDEFPQFWNVLRGDMSLVGPRPALPNEIEEYSPWQRRRLSLQPGITCIWQVSARNGAEFEKWMEMDLRYIDNWSLWLDFRILVLTARAVFCGSGK